MYFSEFLPTITLEQLFHKTTFDGHVNNILEEIMMCPFLEKNSIPPDHVTV